MQVHTMYAVVSDHGTYLKVDDILADCIDDATLFSTVSKAESAARKSGGRFLLGLNCTVTKVPVCVEVLSCPGVVEAAHSVYEILNSTMSTAMKHKELLTSRHLVTLQKIIGNRCFEDPMTTSEDYVSALRYWLDEVGGASLAGLHQEDEENE